MCRLILSVAWFLIFLPLKGQTLIQGQVTDERGEGVVGANVFIEGTYDGTSSGLLGSFALSTDLKGGVRLRVSYLSYESLVLGLILKNGDTLELDLVLEPLANELSTVVISAGSFEASDQKKAVVLRPLDIVTTAGANGDIVGALTTLPGAQPITEDGRLFVRGGAASETQTFIDGMLVPTPYGSTVPDVPARGRFAPFLFKGTVFSTGGYSAEYGQALSSALILNTHDLAQETVTGLSLMTVGLGLSHTQRWKNTSLSVSGDYTNLAPYTALAPQNIDWEKPYSGEQGQIVFRHKTSTDGILKVLVQGSHGGFRLQHPATDDPSVLRLLTLTNASLYFNSSFREILNDKWTLFAGVAYNYNQDDVQENFEFHGTHRAWQTKFRLAYQLSHSISLKGGFEYLNSHVQEHFHEGGGGVFSTSLPDQYGAFFSEGDCQINDKLVARLGIRMEYSDLLSHYNWAPRLSLAYRTGADQQVSFAYGQYFQIPTTDRLRYQRSLDYEQATHYIANYQITRSDRIFRIEAFWKKYGQLVRFPAGEPWLSDNSGTGYARGVDVFFRDKKTIENGDYWISYSWLDTERYYLDFPEASSPNFAADHTLSVVYKHWVSAWSTQIGCTFTWAGSRAYDDPNTSPFNDGRTRPFRDLSINASYLTRIFDNFTIIYASVSNVPGFDNEFGRRFSDQPNAEGRFTSIAIRPPAPRFFFVGIFLSIGDNERSFLNL